MDRLMTFSFQAQQTPNQKTPSQKLHLYKFDKVAQFQQEISQLKTLTSINSKRRSKSTLDPCPTSTSNHNSNKQYQTISEQQQTPTSPFKSNESKHSSIPPKATIQQKKTEKATQTQSDATEEKISQMQHLVNQLLEQKNDILDKIQTASKEKNQLKSELSQLKQQENEWQTDIRELKRVNEQLLEKEKYYQMNLQQCQQKISEVRTLNENKNFANLLSNLTDLEQQELARALLTLFKSQGNRLEVAQQFYYDFQLIKNISSNQKQIMNKQIAEQMQQMENQVLLLKRENEELKSELSSLENLKTVLEPELLSVEESLILIREICRRAVKSAEILTQIKKMSELPQLIEEISTLIQPQSKKTDKSRFNTNNSFFDQTQLYPGQQIPLQPKNQKRQQSIDSVSTNKKQIYQQHLRKISTNQNNYF